jgi:hypothetical protein
MQRTADSEHLHIHPSPVLRPEPFRIPGQDDRVGFWPGELISPGRGRDKGHPKGQAMQARQMIKVVEVRTSASAKEIEDQLNAPYAEGFYYASQLPTDAPGIVRVLYKRRVKEG